jgi:serine/threonine protein phosphatase PrpC
MYAGYLLKRSNHPYRASPSPPPFFPIEDQLTDESHAIYTQPQPQYSNSERLEPEPSHIHSHIDDSVSKKNDMLPNDEGFNFITSLFGIELPPTLPTNDPSSDEPPTTTLVTTASMKSLPIKMTSHPCDDYDDDIATEIDEEDFCDSPPQAQAIPMDTIDPTDQHIWRVKYCVLDGDVLYFYSSQDVAESTDAVQERRRGDIPVGDPSYATPHAYKDLSQSPRPLRWVRPDESSHLWEKRVELQYVGAVRSAELEYGPFALELTSSSTYGSDEEEEYDKLVLRAANGDEMKEWLFQFLRCIASLVWDLVALRTAGDLHLPAPSTNGLLPTSPVRSLQQNGSSLRSFVSFSPRYHKVLNAMSCLSSSGSQTRTAPLSHGHGRSAMRRRRQEASSAHPELGTLDPKSPELPFPTMTTISGMSSRLVTPMVPMAPESSLQYSPEVSSQYPTMFAMDSPSPDGIASANASSANAGTAAPSLPPMGQPEHWNSASNLECVSTGLPATGGKYIPPHLRNRTAESNNVTPMHRNATVERPLATPYIPRHSRPFPASSTNGSPEAVKLSALNSIYESAVAIPNHSDVFRPFSLEDQGNDEIFKHFKLGGCADTAHVFGSILDSVYIPRKASKLGKVRTHPFGYNATTNVADSSDNSRMNLAWEIGAFSECGVRDFNEDSFLITSDILQAFDHVHQSKESRSLTIWDKYSVNSHPPSLFAIFDGHCGDQASRYAAEKLTRFIYEESLQQGEDKQNDLRAIHSTVAEILSQAVKKLDQEFCKLCVEDGREWESGSTALIAALGKEHLIVANLGDARGILGRSVSRVVAVDQHMDEGWNELPVDDSNGKQTFLWKEIADVHSPNRDDERDRIQRAGGWVTTEYDIPVAQLKRMALDDDDVVDILSRCFQTSTKASAPHRVLQISRVCGELAVSRALGDRDFKASSYNTGISTRQSDAEYKWDSSRLGLIYPAGHDQWFKGDLISNKPDFHAVQVGAIGVSDEFLLLACDGLWDVIDSDDAYRFTRDLLFEKNWSAKETAGRLAELALHLGSSDNITVIVVRFFKR